MNQQQVLVLAGGAIAIAALAFGIWKYRKSLPTAEELERRRRLYVHEKGKLGVGRITDFDAGHISYTYLVAGVEYSTSQDVSTLPDLLPPTLQLMIDNAGVKFDPRNPPNSIVICEQWSGFEKVRRSRLG